VTPLAVNPAPDAVTPEIVTLALPVFVSVATSEFVLPTVTAPKFNDAALEVSAGVGLDTALPLVEIVSGEFGASLIRATEPLTFPAVVGAKTILKVALCPAAMYVGMASPATLKPPPVTFACEIVACAVPLFETVIVW
jgi:hypothetical protein